MKEYLPESRVKNHSAERYGNPDNAFRKMNQAILIMKKILNQNHGSKYKNGKNRIRIQCTKRRYQSGRGKQYKGTRKKAEKTCREKCHVNRFRRQKEERRIVKQNAESKKQRDINAT